MTDPFDAAEGVESAARTLTRRETLLAGTAMLAAWGAWPRGVTGAPSAARQPNVLSSSPTTWPPGTLAATDGQATERPESTGSVPVTSA